jgi:hypothetical protein
VNRGDVAIAHGRGRHEAVINPSERARGVADCAATMMANSSSMARVVALRPMARACDGDPAAAQRTSRAVVVNAATANRTLRDAAAVNVPATSSAEKARSAASRPVESDVSSTGSTKTMITSSGRQAAVSFPEPQHPLPDMGSYRGAAADGSVWAL